MRWSQYQNKKEQSNSKPLYTRKDPVALYHKTTQNSNNTGTTAEDRQVEKQLLDMYYCTQVSNLGTIT